MPTLEEMRAAGFEPEDYETDPVEVWPENWASWEMFSMVSTQWRVDAMGAYIGLDYVPLFALMDRRGLKDDDWLEMLDDVRVIEAEALDTMREQ